MEKKKEWTTVYKGVDQKLHMPKGWFAQNIKGGEERGVLHGNKGNNSRTKKA